MGTPKTTGRFLRWDAADTTGIVGTLHVLAFCWTGTANTNRDVADNDNFEITDQDDLILMEKCAEGAGDDIPMVVFPRGACIFNGIKVAQLDGGEFFLWLYNDVPTSRTG